MATTKVVPLVTSPLLKEHTCRTAGILCGRLTSLIGDIKSISTSKVFSLGMPKPEYHMDIKTNRWHRVIAEADKLLEHPTMTMSGPMLHDYDVLSMSNELNTTLEPEHPLLKIFKCLTQEQRSMQAKGLILLLFAKVVGQMDQSTQPSREDKIKRQHCLATGTDLTHMAVQAHVSVSNVNGMDSITCTKLDYVNKLAILFGDIMLSKANLFYGSIKNTKIAYNMSTAMRETTSGRFLFDQDDQGNAYPVKTTTMTDWETRSFMINSALLANAMKSMAIIQELGDDCQNRGYQLGKLLGLAWQASAELEPFVDPSESSSTAPFSLVSCPVVLYLQRDRSILDFLAPFRNDLSKVDYKKIYEMVGDSPAVREAQEVCQNHVHGALNVLQHFPNSKARIALENIVASLEV